MVDAQVEEPGICPPSHRPSIFDDPNISSGTNSRPSQHSSSSPHVVNIIKEGDADSVSSDPSDESNVENISPSSDSDSDDPEDKKVCSESDTEQVQKMLENTTLE